MPHWDGGIGFHYVEPFRTLLGGGLEALERADARDSHHYSVPGELHQDKVEWEDEPLRYQGGALVLPTRPTSFVQNILHCAEAIARDRAVWFGRRTNEGH